MEYISIRNWSKYQHYKKDNPAWIKLYARTLNSEAYYNLSQKGKFLFLTLLMLACAKNNRIPNNTKWICDRGLIEMPIDLNELLNVAPDPLIELVYSNSIPETETETEKRHIASQSKINCSAEEFDTLFPKGDEPPPDVQLAKTNFPHHEEHIRPLLDKFFELWNAETGQEPSKPLVKQWAAGARTFYASHGGDADMLEKCILSMRDKGLIVASPGSCVTEGWEQRKKPRYIPTSEIKEFD